MSDETKIRAVTESESDPWAGGTLYASSAAAQRAFDRAEPVGDDSAAVAAEYHRNVATADDRARCDAIAGDQEQVAAWY